VPRISAALTLAAAGSNNSGRAARSNNDLCAALLAIAGHDLRQPLQVIIGVPGLALYRRDQCGTIPRTLMVRVTPG